MNDAFVIFARELLQTLREERAAKLPNETGGFLIGLRRGDHIEVTKATTQLPDDVATRTSFLRRDKGHASTVDRAWRRSGEFETLVGDWHSHPSGSAYPSGVDRAAWTKLAAAAGTCIGVILNDDPLPRVYRFRARLFRLGVEELWSVADEPSGLVFGADRGKS